MYCECFCDLKDELCNMARYKDNKTLTFYLLKNGLIKSWKNKTSALYKWEKIIRGMNIIKDCLDFK